MSAHWESYYRTGSIPSVPSQFCVFVANEFPEIGTVVEAGCGNGRDALFFARTGRNVVAFDASAAAVEQCRSGAGENARFINGAADVAETWDAVRGALGEAAGPVLVYARFFLHAIDEAAETAFLRLAASLLKETGGKLCVECRTVRDRDQQKVTPDHYRRFVEPLHLAAKLHETGLNVEYFVEGYGMAKYGADDAYVVRIIAG
jgi:SAM-dependent methyltransferase